MEQLSSLVDNLEQSKSYFLASFGPLAGELVMQCYRPKSIIPLRSSSLLLSFPPYLCRLLHMHLLQPFKHNPIKAELFHASGSIFAIFFQSTQSHMLIVSC